MMALPIQFPGGLDWPFYNRVAPSGGDSGHSRRSVVSEAKPLTKEEIERARKFPVKRYGAAGYQYPPERWLATLEERSREIKRLQVFEANVSMFKGIADKLQADVDRLTRERDEARHKAFRECAEITAGAVPSNRDDPRYLSLRWVLERIRVACPEAFSDSPSAKDISAVIDEVCAFISPETCGADAGWFTPDKAEGSPGLRAAIDQAREHAKE